MEESKLPALPTITLDESGNTGSDILNQSQPLLVLASVNFTRQHLDEAEELFRPINALEWKFSRFKKHPSQLALLKKLLHKDWINESSVKVHIIHKRFFAVTKIVDLVFEPIAYDHDVDLYEKGAAVSTANLMVTVLPVWLGEEMFSKLLETFISLIRNRTEEGFQAFKEIAIEAHAKIGEVSDDKTFNLLSPLLYGCLNPESWLPFIPDGAIEPLAPAYFSLIDSWGQELGCEFAVLSDKSKALSAELEMLGKLSDINISPKTLPAVGNGWARFPLRAPIITQSESKGDRSVQLADLIAGAANHTFSPFANLSPADEWQEACKDLFFKKQLIQRVLFPSDEVTPEGVGAEHVTGEKPLDYTVEILRKG